MIFQVQAPPGWGGAYIWRGDLTEGFLRYRFGEIIFRGAYFRNFTVGSHFLKSSVDYFLNEDFKIPMNNASVFSCYGHFLRARLGK